MAKIELNVKGMKYTMPVVKAAMAIKKGKPGDVFVVASDYPAFELDIQKWCDETGNLLESILKSNNEITATIIKKN